MAEITPSSHSLDCTLCQLSPPGHVTACLCLDPVMKAAFKLRWLHWLCGFEARTLSINIGRGCSLQCESHHKAEVSDADLSGPSFAGPHPAWRRRAVPAVSHRPGRPHCRAAAR